MAKKVIRLKESELTNLVKKVLNEMYECNKESVNEVEDDDEDDDLLQYVTKYTDDVLDDLEEYRPDEEPGDSEDLEDDEYVEGGDEEGDDLEAFEDKPEEEPVEKKKYLHGKFDPTNWFNIAQDKPDEEQHEDGEVIYHENIPIEKRDGRYYMTIEDGFKTDNGGCPRIDVVSDSLNKVKAEYNRLWDKYYYKDHGKYAEEMIKRGKGELQVDDQDELNDGTRFEDFPVFIDLDK